MVKQALSILKAYPEFCDMPASISGKYHFNETCYDHAMNAASVMNHLCDNFDIKEDRGLLISAAILHDLGLVLITQKGEVKWPGWKFHEKTGYSRQERLYTLHGALTPNVLVKHDIERKDELNTLVESHMSHWCPTAPQPKTWYQKLVCIADYVAAKNNGMLTHKKVDDYEKTFHSEDFAPAVFISRKKQLP